MTNRARFLALGIVLTLSLAFIACISGSPPDHASADASSARASLEKLRYSCAGGPGFRPGLLDEPATAELGDHPSAVALRDALAADHAGIGMLPDTGYWLVGRDAREAHYMAARPADRESPFVYAVVQANAGGWAVTGFGDCRPYVLLEGQSPASWILDPETSSPDRSTSKLTVLVTEQACTGGARVDDRLLPPTVIYTSDAVLIIFAARPARGLTTCPGNPPARVAVELRESLGDRLLLDAGVYPPMEPVAPDF